MKAGLMLAVNPDAERQANDFYATDPYAVYKMRNTFEEIGLCHHVWEPACGLGHISEALRNIGYNVLSTDLVDYGYDGMADTYDFLSNNDIKFDGDIVTNPPFKLASQFIKKAMASLGEGHIAVMLLKVQFLETKRRADLFQSCGLKYVIVNSERICCAKEGQFDRYFKKGQNGEYKGGTQLYCWFVFEKGYNGNATIKFV